MAGLTQAQGKARDTQRIRDDLGAFGLSLTDIDARPLLSMDYDAYGIGQGNTGYRIPYFDIDGTAVSHSRVRLLDLHAKPGEGGNFIRSSKDECYLYFPIDFSLALSSAQAEIPFQDEDGQACTWPVVVVCDDERVAAWVQKTMGVPAVAAQGAGGWKRGDLEAFGMTALVERLLERDACVILWIGDGSDPNVQREVATLAMEFKFRGLRFDRVRQFLGVKLTRHALGMILHPLTAFPRHPNIRSYIASRMDVVDRGGKITRRGMQEVGLAMLADLEANGRRIQSVETGEFYYFDNGTRELLRASVVIGKEFVTASEFGAYLYNRYGISTVDNAIMRWFATQLASEKPIRRTRSIRKMNTLPRTENTVSISVTPSAFVHIEGSESRVLDNGSRGLLFEKSIGDDAPFAIGTYHDAVEAQRKQAVLPFWWHSVMQTVRIGSDEELRTLVSLMYYVSPWLKGWRGIQLPIEVMVGEAGTGKSSTFTLRLLIITGRGKLRNMPDELKSFYAMLSANPGLLVFDNVHLMKPTLRQQFSDEMCRLTTELDPRIETRKLFTTADVAEMSVGCSFGMTSVVNVFSNVDFIQRSVILKTSLPEGELGSEHTYINWVDKQLQRFGGREVWFAHHIVALERFFRLAAKEWRTDYKSAHRLSNFEQALMLMGKVFGLDVSWLPAKLADMSKQNTLSLDETLSGLKSFTEELVLGGETVFTAGDVTDWATGHEDYNGNGTLTSTRRLGRYIAANLDVVRRTTGVRIRNAGISPRTYEVVRDKPAVRRKR